MSELENPTSRRNLLKFGGAGVAGAALLAACGSDGRPVGVSGSPPPTTAAAPTVPDAPVTDAMKSEAQDQLKTLASLEALAAKVYGEHGSTVTNPELQPVMSQIAGHHEEAATAISDLTDDGEKATPNEDLESILVTPRVPHLDDPQSVLNLLSDIESTLAASYIASVEVVTELEQRTTLMGFGGAAARRATVLGNNGEGTVPANALYPPTNLIPGSSMLVPEGGEGEEAAPAEGAEGEDDTAEGEEAGN